MTPKQLFTVLPQYLLPQHFLSVCLSKVTHSQNPLVKNLFINTISKLYGVNLQEAKQPDPAYYQSFNQFFTRELKDGVRPIASAANALVSPADGAISQAGRIDGEQIFQAKGHHYTVQELLGGDAALAEQFQDGSFATVYLSPKDYHRLHMPLGGTLTEMIHVPGKLFSVNASTVSTVPRLFVRNERVVCLFDTEVGQVALILVGAIFVSSIETVWHGVVTPPTAQAVRNWHYQEQPVTLDKGQEMGRFNMGSTIIMLFPKDKIAWNSTLTAGAGVKMGEMIGTITPANVA